MQERGDKHRDAHRAREREQSMAKWSFHCNDNGGKFQGFTITASSKPEAIEKAMQKAKKAAKGDINAWDCKLVRA